MREIATKKKPVFVQANSNSGQGHVLHYITSFCVVFRLSTLYFWLAGKTETYGSPQVHSECQMTLLIFKHTPDSKSSLLILKAYSKFQNFTPNFKTSLRIWKLHSEFENFTPNSKLHSEFENATPNSKTPLRTWKHHSKLEFSTPNSKTSLPIQNRKPRVLGLFGQR